MTRNLGGPREGKCHVISFIVLRDDEHSFATCDDKDLGVMPWAELIDSVAERGGTRPTFDLFDVPQDDGTVLRYRAVNERLIP
jgi:hypothetical protein